MRTLASVMFAISLVTPVVLIVVVVALNLFTRAKS